MYVIDDQRIEMHHTLCGKYSISMTAESPKGLFEDLLLL